MAFGNAFDEHERCLLAGYDNGDLKLFDLRTNTCGCTLLSLAHPQTSAAAHNVSPVLTEVEDACRVRWETTLHKGVCGVAFDRQDIPMNKFAAACLESHCVFFDARTQHPETGNWSLVNQAGLRMLAVQSCFGLGVIIMTPCSAQALQLATSTQRRVQQYGAARICRRIATLACLPQATAVLLCAGDVPACSHQRHSCVRYVILNVLCVAQLPVPR